MSTLHLMRVRRLAELVILVALFVVTASAHAAPVTVGPVVITVPEGFAAAQTQKQKKTLITAWTKFVRNGSLKTLLQINVIDFGSPPGKPAATQDQAVGFPTGLPIYIDPDGLKEAEVTMASTITMNLEGIPLRTTLRLLLSQLHLIYKVEDGLLLITNEPAKVNRPAGLQ